MSWKSVGRCDAEKRLQYARKHYQIPLIREPRNRVKQTAASHQSPCARACSCCDRGTEDEKVELTSEIAKDRKPIFFYSEKAESVWGEELTAGAAKRDPTLGPPEILLHASLAIGDGDQ
ncbi:hypothetical protein JK2ML_0369 [Mycobacterium leprae Kyoto-2]|uniref:Uncharacterized protein n=4 Tax=Mycobacterium leprae TaxID=1769 RepID=Q49877_MYCLE|nr:B229_F2_65 [Mycobacterium leprae]OAR21521.1 hypothetical protein A8144_05675 [Mycobacterium leprae 3125609]OAX71453.1 hypothetical protein A3216_05820 [Mycobacterium leprae 7935681]CAR70462.1 hypothetical protein MLBr00369 [Mycobacterium leprae Br4923]BBC16526.1 hypothetical protein JK2ML_0369 [Mycobacterium leprae Kyoto-2]